MFVNVCMLFLPMKDCGSLSAIEGLATEAYAFLGTVIRRMSCSLVLETWSSLTASNVLQEGG